jgi:hypothetical protein
VSTAPRRVVVVTVDPNAPLRLPRVHPEDTARERSSSGVETHVGVLQAPTFPAASRARTATHAVLPAGGRIVRDRAVVAVSSCVQAPKAPLYAACRTRTSKEATPRSSVPVQEASQLGVAATRDTGAVSRAVGALVSLDVGRGAGVGPDGVGLGEPAGVPVEPDADGVGCGEGLVPVV